MEFRGYTFMNINVDNDKRKKKLLHMEPTCTPFPFTGLSSTSSGQTLEYQKIQNM